MAVPAGAGELVDLETPRVVAEALMEPGASGELCWRMAEIGIRLKRPARVTVRVDGQLVLSGVDGGSTFEEGTDDFFDLGNNRYRFAGAGDARRRRERLRLRSVTEPSGAEVVLRHDSEGRLVRVEEKRRGGARLELTYTRAGGFDRVAAIRDTLRRATVRYSYDALGNLTQVTRTSAVGTQVLARYTYSVDDARDPHQLLSAETPTDTMRYMYYREGDRFAGEGTRAVGLPRLGLGASARAVTRETEQGDDSTLFGYDDSGWSEGTVRSWVASSSNDSAWQVTLYVLDQSGRAVEVKEHASAPTGLIAVGPPSCAVAPAPSGCPRSARLGTPARPAALCRRTD